MSSEEVKTEEKKEEKKEEEKKEKKLDAKALKKLENQQNREKERLKQLEEKMKSLEVVVSFEDLVQEKVIYGKYPLIQSNVKVISKYSKIEEANKDLDGNTVTYRARIHTIRKQGKGAFIDLRQGLYTIQAVCFPDEKISAEMIKFINAQSKESIVDVTGKITSVKEETSTTQKDVELQVQKFFTVVTAISPLPLLIEDSMTAEEDETKKEEVKEEKKEEVKEEEKKEGEKEKKKIIVGQDTRLNNRVLDLRAPTNIAIFKIQSGVGYFFRKFLYEEEFVEIHTPKLIGAASEGGADVFEVKYFDTFAYLAQSPQLYKQMAVMGDLMRVFEIGPVFRAEKSFTHRHLCEFVGLDIEMSFQSHYHEVLDVIDKIFINIFEGINNKYQKELEIIAKQYPFKPLRYSKEKNLRLEFADAIKLLNEDAELKNKSIEKEEEKFKILSKTDDIDTKNEKRLGAIVAEKYETDFFILDKFPLCLRPFYTMPDKDDPELSNSYDLFIRGEEIVSGAQRIHDVELLIERAIKKGVKLNTIQPYIDAFKYGAYPHAGCGIGLERVTMLFLGLHNIRKTSMFPRDPKRLFP